MKLTIIIRQRKESLQTSFETLLYNGYKLYVLILYFTLYHNLNFALVINDRSYKLICNTNKYFYYPCNMKVLDYHSNFMLFCQLWTSFIFTTECQVPYSNKKQQFSLFPKVVFFGARNNFLGTY